METVERGEQSKTSELVASGMELRKIDDLIEV